MTKLIGVVFGLGLLAAPALLPAAAPEPLEACYQLPDGAPRLACFNREMQRRHSGGAITPAPRSSASATTASAPDEHGAASHARTAARARRRRPLRAAERSSVVGARIARLLPQAHGEYRFELDNGQTWEQTEYVAHLYLRPQQNVQIVPGMFGSYFLTTAHGPRVRVQRIR